jgi:hypothetical protein
VTMERRPPLRLTSAPADLGRGEPNAATALSDPQSLEAHNVSTPAIMSSG